LVFASAGFVVELLWLLGGFLFEMWGLKKEFEQRIINFVWWGTVLKSKIG